MSRSTRLFATSALASTALGLAAALLAADGLAQSARGCSGNDALPPEIVRSALAPIEFRGEGELRWFGILAYRARLWTPPGTVTHALANGPLAFEIRYARRFRHDQLASRSIGEMKHIAAGSEAQYTQWFAAMMNIFRDVDEGDCLLGVLMPNGATRFYYNSAPIGTVDDPEFGRAFFGIWLSPSTSQPALRKKLIGESK